MRNDWQKLYPFTYDDQKPEEFARKMANALQEIM